MVQIPWQGQKDLCSYLSNTEHFFPCPSLFGSMASQFSRAFLQEHKELQLVGNIPGDRGLTRSLMAQCPATNFWPEYPISVW